MDNMKMIKVPTDGIMFAEIIDACSLENAAEMIAAEIVEVVRPVAFAEMDRPDFVLLIDESGALKDDRKMNPCASELYGWRRHGVKIYGDVLVAKEVVNEDGEIDISGLTEDEADEAMGIMFSV